MNRRLGITVREFQTTNPAEAARISCRFALVKADSIAQNTNVNMKITIILSGLVVIVPASENLYSSQTGTTSSAKIMHVTITVAHVAIRARSK